DAARTGKLVELAAVHLVEHARPAELRHREIHEVAPARLGVERGVDVQERRLGAQQGVRERERAHCEAREAASQPLAPAFAADLEMHEVEARGKPRAEQPVEMRGHAADRIAARPEQHDHRTPHAALRSGTCKRGLRSSEPLTPSASYTSSSAASARSGAARTRAVSRAAAPMRAASGRSASRRAIARCRLALSPGATSRPLAPSTTTSAMPPTLVATTGMPALIASSRLI